MVLSGHLTQKNAGTQRPLFTLKGAVALEMRLPFKARATRDIDLIVENSDENDPVSILREALEGDCQGFTLSPALSLNPLSHRTENPRYDGATD